MKKLIVALLAIIAFVLLIVVILDDDPEAIACEPLDTASAGGAGNAGAVNAEGLAEPIENGLDHMSSPYRGDRPDHHGADIAVPHGTPIRSMADGHVLHSGVSGGADTGFGTWLVIEHEIDGDVVATVYGHMYPGESYVEAGEDVKAGQHIADVGNYGGSTGDHLHFEVHPGGYISGSASSVDPLPWLESAASGADSDTSNNSMGTPGDATETAVTLVADSTDELPTSDAIVSEDKLQSDAVQVARAVAAKWPEIDTIGGWREFDSTSDDHPSGRAVDVMIPDWQTDDGKSLGDEITDYLYEHREHFNVEYLIWRQQLTPAEGEPYVMDDLRDPTLNHFDHVHVTVGGKGLPGDGETYSAPGGGSSAATPKADQECETPADLAGVDVGLNEGEIPEELVKWIKLAGRLCLEAPAPIIAGLIYQESAFQPKTNPHSGAMGYGQFMPYTWPEKGAKVDDNGEVDGPPGSGDPYDPADSIMATGRYLCEIADGQRDMIANGQLEGDPTELMLAGYNAGPGAVQQAGGVPMINETMDYVVLIPAHAERFESTV